MKIASLCILVSGFLVGLVASKKLASPEDAALPKPTNDMMYVVSYSHKVSLEDLVNILNETKVHVERQLSCTRGVVVHLTEEGARKMNSIDGLQLHTYSSTHAAQKDKDQNDRALEYYYKEEEGNLFSDTHARSAATTPITSINIELNEAKEQEDNRTFHRYKKHPFKKKNLEEECVCENFKGPDVFTFAEAKGIWQYIIDHIKTGPRCFDGSVADCAGALLRNAFHDAAPFNGSDKKLSGSNGCVDLSSPGNNGLANANRFLRQTQRLVFRRTRKRISMADIIAIAGSAAVKATGGPTIKVKLGRRDIPCKCEETVLPPAEQPEDAEDTVLALAKQLGFNGKNMVALMGAHTVGRLVPENTGYFGTWVPDPDAAVFSNTYFWGMFCIPWLKVQRSTFNGVQLNEWLVDPSIGNITFLNTDAILAFKDIENCDLFGGVRHLPPGIDPSVCDVILPDGTNAGPFADPDIPGATRCDFRDDIGLEASVEFTLDQDLYFKKFKTAYKKMVETTVPCDVLYTPV